MKRKESYTVVSIRISDNEEYCSDDCFYLDAYHNDDGNVVWCCNAYEEDEDHYQTLIIDKKKPSDDDIKKPRCEQCKNGSKGYAAWFKELLEKDTEKHRDLYDKLSKS